MQQHAKQHQRTFPMAAETVLKSTCMDDSMDSVLNEEQGMALYKDLSVLMTKSWWHAWSEMIVELAQANKGDSITGQKV